MRNVKDVIAKNLAELRRDHKLTQQQLADKLNYSDKAVSRWEHGETLPDIETLCKICDIYGVSFEYLLEEEQPQPSKNPHILKKDIGGKISITLIAICTVWLVAIIAVITLNMLGRFNSWKIFIWALPITGFVASACNRLWGNRILGAITSSFTVWTLILAIYVHLLDHNFWMFFLIGVPVQMIIILYLTIKRGK